MATGMASPEIEAKEEDELTTEERLAWLRARGVLVEEPASRRKAPAGGGRPFTYVKIPCLENYCLEELTGNASVGDALPSIIGPMFAGGNVSDAELEAQAAQMGQVVNIDAIRKVMSQGGAESFRLAVPTDGNGREGVYAYLDEASSLKDLPDNARAIALARQCGFPATLSFKGDIYIGRQRWSKDGIVENIDFDLTELEPNTLWIRRAVVENLEFQKSTMPDEHENAQASIGTNASGEGDGYTWRDEAAEMEVVVRIAKETTKKDVKVEFRRQEIRITKPVSMSLKLFKPIEMDGCNWTMGDGQLVLTLEKACGEPWPQLCA